MIKMVKNETKQKLFADVAERITEDELKKSFLEMCNYIPDYIFYIPASSSGKYHNKQQCKKHGQLIHSWMANDVLEYLIGLEHISEKLTEHEKNLMRIAICFHDVLKGGWEYEGYTKQLHPRYAVSWLYYNCEYCGISDDDEKELCSLVASHSGQWNKDKAGAVILPKPITFEQQLIHEADYLASRKDLTYVISKEKKKELRRL